MSQMTDHDAWAIQKTILQMEFPFMVVKSLQFAGEIDIWNSDYIDSSPQNFSTVRLIYFVQAIC